ncbi:hypothetical protein PTSG_02437 [Salpingoeca rosetta]|uniref:Uncharacterized protein n=1 Tax=Salpingoeca rosetta (strain ATCC 50818 / BSB-021) TaxID=946362 RepID=F2U274_SALR5|nr:uncharacterized protein PTSG_02437 [Salpingoeca rosetta]EGD81726.1 hypothetical protein PTSG_02437 [Salpingoeca rosetta]|eukprot:XP_004996930.1 hypothetical protein PTSG_02437 [Salpingoeca rosetta]
MLAISRLDTLGIASSHAASGEKGVSKATIRRREKRAHERASERPQQSNKKERPLPLRRHQLQQQQQQQQHVSSNSTQRDQDLTTQTLAELPDNCHKTTTVPNKTRHHHQNKATPNAETRVLPCAISGLALNHTD